MPIGGMANLADVLKHLPDNTSPAQLPEAEGDEPEAQLDRPVTEGRTRVVRNKVELAHRRMGMAQMFAEGKYLRTIAKKYGTSVSNVSTQINELVAEYQSAARKSVGEKIAKVDALIYMVMLEAIEAWFESKQGTITNTKKRAREIRSAFPRGAGKAPKLGPNKVAARIRDSYDNIFGDDEDEAQIEQPVTEREEENEREETSPGDPRFLKIILECMDRYIDLHNLNPKDGGPTGDEELQAMTSEQRKSLLYNYLEKAKQNKAKQIAIVSAQTRQLPEAQSIPVSAYQAQQYETVMELWDADAGESA